MATPSTSRRPSVFTPTATITATADDPPALARLQVGGVDPQVGPGALDRAGEEGVHPLVDLLAQPRLTWLFEMPPRAHGLDQVVDRAGRDPVDVGLLDHRRRAPSRPCAAAPGSREVASPCAASGSPARSGRPGSPRPAPGSRCGELRRSGLRAPRRAPVAASTSSSIMPLGREGQHLAHQVAIGPLLDQLDQRHSLVGHRRLRFGSRSRNPNLLRRPAMTAQRHPGRALRYAEGSARGLLHHVRGHDPLAAPCPRGDRTMAPPLQHRAPHSALGYRSPMEVLSTNAAAALEPLAGSALPLIARFRPENSSSRRP